MSPRRGRPRLTVLFLLVCAAALLADGGGPRISAPAGPATGRPPLPSSLTLAGLDRLLQRGQARRAMAGYAHRVAATPSETAAALGLVAAAGRAGRLDWAQRFLRAVRRRMPTAAVFLGEAEIAFYTAQHERALQFVEKAYRRLPVDVDIVFARSAALAAVGNVPAAALAVDDFRLDDLEAVSAHTVTLQRAATLASLVEPHHLGHRAAQRAWLRAVLQNEADIKVRALVLALAIQGLAGPEPSGLATAERAVHYAVRSGNQLASAMALIAMADRVGREVHQVTSLSAACAALANMGDAVRADCLLSALKVAWSRGALARAQLLYDAAMPIAGTNAILSVGLATSAVPMLQATGRLREASEVARRGVRAAEAIGHGELEAGLLADLASSRRQLGDLPGAKRAALEALNVVRPDDVATRLRATVVAANVAASMGNERDAERLLAEAETVASIENRSGELIAGPRQLTVAVEDGAVRRLRLLLELIGDDDRPVSEAVAGVRGRPREIAKHAITARILEADDHFSAALDEYRLALSALRLLRDTSADAVSRALVSDSWQELNRRAMSVAFEMGRWELAVVLLEDARSWPRTDGQEDNNNRLGFDPDSLGRSLPPGTAVIVYAIVPDAVWAVVLSQNGGRAVRLPIDPESLRHLVALWRATITRGGDLRVWERVGHRLSSALLAPLLPDEPLDQATLVYVVPDDALHSIPLPALPDDENASRLHAELKAWSRIPSLSLLWRTLQTAPRKGPLVAFGPQGGSDTVLEMYSAAQGRGFALLGPRATKAKWKEYSSMAGVLHFGGHAFPPAPDLGEGALVLRGDRIGGDKLTIPEIMSLRVNGAAVVLLACDSATRPAGSLIDGLQHEVPSIAEAFLFAGARSVVANLWPITEQNARELAVEFYRAGGPAGGVDSLEVARKRLRQRWPNDPQRWAGAIWIGAAEAHE